MCEREEKTINGTLYHRRNENSEWVGLSYTQLNKRIIELNERNNSAVIQYAVKQRVKYALAKNSAEDDGRTNDHMYYDGKVEALSELLGHFCEMDKDNINNG